jgi:hypothetical protein
MSVTGFKGLGDELGVGFCGCVLFFDESFRHLKTTVSNWHIILLGVLEFWKVGVLERQHA